MRPASLSFERELRRIGVHVMTLGGLSVSKPMTPDAILSWLRTLPTGFGHREFTRRLRLSAAEGGPGMALDNPDLPVADPDYRDPELDEEIALQREMDRVVWPTLRKHSAAESLGLDRVPDRRTALENLRRLPNDASYEDVMAAMYPSGSR